VTEIPINSEITPKASRYIPFTQQPACCVPTCIQMIMYKNNIPLIPAEEIGYALGLIVHPDKSNLFYNTRTSTTRPAAGYGTRIYDPEYEPNVAFKKLNIPLSFSIKSITDIRSEKQLIKTLSEVESFNQDVLICFHQGALENDPNKDWGHVCVFDRIINGEIRFIDPSPSDAKWRTFSAEALFESMQQHGAQRSAGLWYLELK